VPDLSDQNAWRGLTGRRDWRGLYHQLPMTSPFGFTDAKRKWPAQGPAFGSFLSRQHQGDSGTDGIGRA